MFENLLGQSAAKQLITDIEGEILAPAMLFSGPPASGKGTAALELGRVISCENSTASQVKAPWVCQCSACSRHRIIVHQDLLCLGWKPFSAEIAASAAAFLREKSFSSSQILFIRSLRKLLARFNPVLWEDEPKGAKISSLVSSIEEDLDELDFSIKSGADVSKLTESIVKNALRLESEGLSENIPIAQIRRAAFWGRLAPSGNGKLLVIENSDRMQDEARNSLLKLLEEPPAKLTIVLTTTRPGSLLPTMLSRLRPYRFNSRERAVEEEVIRRVFKDPSGQGEINGPNLLGAYLDSFLQVSADTLEALAAFFTASVAYKAVLLAKRRGRQPAEEVVLLGKYSAPRAEAAGLGRPEEDSGAVITHILEKAAKFELRRLFSGFLACLLEQVSRSQRQAALLPPVSYNELWKDSSKWAETAVGIYNLRPAQALEKMFTDLSRGMADL